MVFQILSTLMAILLSGCVSQQLSVEKHGRKLAPRLSVNESEIQFVSYAAFIAKLDNPNRRFITQKGIIALTESDLRLETRHFKYLFSKELTTIPFHEMEGVSLIASQIHIKRGEEEIVLEFNPGSSAYTHSKASESVFQWLAGRGIPVYEVAELTEFPRYSGPIGLAPRSDKFSGSFYDDTLRGHMNDNEPYYYGWPIRVSPNDPDGDFYP